MRVALGLARRGLGLTGPNPTVGCVILDQQGRVAGQARTADGGRPHAETQALAQAGERARGGTAIVTLEPCAHQGETGPCANALISAGIAHAVIATTDPDPRTAGAGIERLSAAGISTEVGVLEAEARALNAGFIKRVTKDLPYLTLKLGLSLDGKIALANGTSQWITGPEARQRGGCQRRTALDHAGRRAVRAKDALCLAAQPVRAEQIADQPRRQERDRINLYLWVIHRAATGRHRAGIEPMRLS